MGSDLNETWPVFKRKKALSNPWLFYAAYCRVFQIEESDAKVMECSCYEQPKIDIKLYILPQLKQGN